MKKIFITILVVSTLFATKSFAQVSATANAIAYHFWQNSL